MTRRVLGRIALVNALPSWISAVPQRLSALLVRLRLRTLPAQLTALLIACLSIAIIGFGWYMGSYQGRHIALAQQYEASTLGDVFATTLAPLIALQDYAGIETTLLSARSSAQLREIRLIRADGEVVCDIRREGDGGLHPHFHTERDSPPADAGPPVQFIQDLTMVLWRPVPQSRPLHWLKLTYSLETAQRAASHVRRISFGAALLATLLSVALLIFYLRPRLAAVRKLHQFAYRLSEHVGERVELKAGAEEIAAIADALNESSQRLAAAQRALWESERMFRELAENIQNVFWVAAPDAPRTTYVSPAYETIWGRSAASLYAQPDSWFEAVHPDDAEHLRAALAKRHDGGYDVEYRIVRPDGTLRWIRDRAFPVRDHDGQVYRVCGIAVDITARKQVEEQARAYQTALAVQTALERQNAELEAARRQAQAASEAKSAFLANISHEIRTPLNAIVGFADLLLGDLQPPLQRARLDNIAKSAHSLLVLLNDILDFAKLEAAELTLRHEPFDLRECIEDGVLLLAPKAQQKNLELVLCCDPQLPRAAIGDANRIRQILINLLDNAIKFTKTGSVAVELARQPTDAGKLAFTLTVSDTGIGIPREAQERIFQPFSQVDTSYAREHAGAGLGLSISRSLAERMGGALVLDSEPGRGTTARATLHCELPAQSTLHLAPSPTNARLRALVWEQQPLARRALAEDLTSLGYTTTPCPSLEALTQGWHALTEDDRRRTLLVAGLPAAPTSNADEWVILRQLSVASAGRIVVLDPRHGANVQSQLETVAQISRPYRLSDLAGVLAVVGALGRTKRAGATGAARGSRGRKLKNLRVLIVDDNPINRELMVSILHAQSAGTTCTSDGYTALQHLEREAFDCLILDMHMPGLDGMDTAMRIRQLPRLRARPIPLIALTADRDLPATARFRKARFDDVLIKPVTKEAVWQAVEQACRHSANPATAAKRRKAPSASRQALPTGGDRDDLRDLLLTTLPTERQRMHSAWNQRNRGELKDVAHRLHGATCYCNVPRLRRAVQHLEECCLDASEHEIDAALDQVLEAMEALSAE